MMKRQDERNRPESIFLPLCLFKSRLHQPVLLGQASTAERGDGRYQHSVSNLPPLSNAPWSILSSTDTGTQIGVDSCTGSNPAPSFTAEGKLSLLSLNRTEGGQVQGVEEGSLKRPESYTSSSTTSSPSYVYITKPPPSART